MMYHKLKVHIIHCISGTRYTYLWDIRYTDYAWIMMVDMSCGWLFSTRCGFILVWSPSGWIQHISKGLEYPSPYVVDGKYVENSHICYYQTWSWRRVPYGLHRLMNPKATCAPKARQCQCGPTLRHTWLALQLTSSRRDGSSRNRAICPHRSSFRTSPRPDSVTSSTTFWRWLKKSVVEDAQFHWSSSMHALPSTHGTRDQITV